MFKSGEYKTKNIISIAEFKLCKNVKRYSQPIFLLIRAYNFKSQTINFNIENLMLINNKHN